MPPAPRPPNPENCSLSELETAANCAPSLASHRRLMAMRMLLLGYTHAQVAELYAVTRRTLQSWIARFNAQGIDGLIERHSTGRARKIAPEESVVYRDLMANPEKAAQTHWTARKFHGYLSEKFQQEIGYRTVVRWLHEQNFRLKVPQPWPDRQDEKLRQAFVEKLRQWLADADIDLWWMDETGVEGDPRPRRRWMQRGEKGRVVKNGDHVRRNVTGMVCPRRGEFYALLFPFSDTGVFQTFLDNANRDVPLERPRNLLICDNASWHKSKSLHWGAFEPIFLPPYSPDLNPIERLWLLMKAEWFSDWVAPDGDALEERLCDALCWLMKRAEANKTTCSIQKII
jgi:transposase